MALSLILLIVVNFFINNRIDILKEKFINLNQVSLENISRNHISKELETKEKGFDYIYSTMVKKDINKETIEEYYKRWEEYMAFTQDISYLYLGTDTGTLYVRPEYTIGEGFVVSERPWYRGAMKNDNKKTWIIYSEYTNGDTLLCLSRKIELGEDRVGVLGMDVSKSQISSYLSEIVKDSKSENVFIMSDSMLIYGELEGPHVDDEILTRLRKEPEKTDYFTDGEWYVFYSPVYIKGWKLVKLVKRSELEKELNSYIKSAELFFHFEIIMVIIGFIYIVYRIRTSHERDSLTGLKNRGLFDKKLSKSNKEKEDYSIIFMDIDNFKKTNDTYGHQVGDAVIRRVGEIIEELMGPKDAAYRYGGEEFVVHSARSRSETYNLGEEIRKQVESTRWREGFNVTISVGIGISKNDDASMVLKRADDLLYNSKRQGKNMVSFEGK